LPISLRDQNREKQRGEDEQSKKTIVGARAKGNSRKKHKKRTPDNASGWGRSAWNQTERSKRGTGEGGSESSKGGWEKGSTKGLWSTRNEKGKKKGRRQKLEPDPGNIPREGVKEHAG